MHIFYYWIKIGILSWIIKKYNLINELLAFVNWAIFGGNSSFSLNNGGPQSMVKLHVTDKYNDHTFFFLDNSLVLSYFIDESAMMFYWNNVISFYLTLI